MPAPATGHRFRLGAGVWPVVRQPRDVALWILDRVSPLGKDIRNQKLALSDLDGHLRG